MHQADQKQAYILLGTNLGDRTAQLEEASILILGSGCKIIQVSSVYVTEAWGLRDQPDFFNQVLKIETVLSPEVLMETMLEIEQKMGRIRNQKYEPRTIDIDLLFFEDNIIQTETLIIPHPEIQNRRFVLEPLCEIDPEMKHPVLLKNIKDLLTDCADPLSVKKLSKEIE
jgi:2-amino-4-hydroxy-6-hydroxymethyldihydropteridine diphosphokinase